jgi:DNA-binding NtrC family response regulator
MDEEKYHILIIEDDLSIRDALCEILCTEGYDADGSADGENGINVFKKKSYDLVIVDLKLPGMDGIEVLRQLKQINHDIVVIIMSGYASLDSAIQAVKDGAYDYLTKPFKLDEIRVAVKNACKKVFLARQQKFYVDELRQANIEPSLPNANSDLETSAVCDEADNVIGELERLSKLLSDGTLTREEFDNLKNKFLLKEN